MVNPQVSDEGGVFESPASLTEARVTAELGQGLSTAKRASYGGVAGWRFTTRSCTKTDMWLCKTGAR